MRLLSTNQSDAGNYEIKEFTDDQIPRYAILSHIWEQDEVLFQDVEGDGDRAKSKKEFDKIKGCCFVALTHGFEYVWIDTCCIDKTSSAELSEAINSMYRWYEQAEICFAYLADVPSTAFKDSRWFTRGWTLQELIAPTNMKFFDATWKKLGSKEKLQHPLSEYTSIPISILSGDSDLDDFSVAQKMSWAAKRKTTRIEDRAYSLMGLFGVNIPLIYGERETAFIRLQEEIMRVMDDHTLFAWRHEDDRAGLLATSPEAFADSHDIVRFNPFNHRGEPCAFSNRGIHLELNFTGIGGKGLGLVILHCKYQDKDDGLIAIYLRDLSLTMEHFRRVDCTSFAQLNLTIFQPYPYPVRRICIQAGRMRRKGRQSLEKWDAAEKHIYSHDRLSHLMNGKEPAKKLLRAIGSGDEDAVWLLLTLSNIGTNSSDIYGDDSLLLATKRGDKLIVQMLLEKGTNVETSDIHNQTSLFWGAKRGHEAVVKLLLDRGAKIEVKNSQGRTPLFQAVEKGHGDIVKLLLERGAQTETGYDDDEMPLFRAAEKGYEDIVKMLLDRGAQVEAKDRDGQTPLCRAMKNRNEAVVNVLLDRGAQMDIKYYNNETPLSTAVDREHDDIAGLLAKIEMEDIDQDTTLSFPIKSGNENMVKLLLDRGARVEPEREDRGSLTPLLLAVDRGHEGIIRLLLDRGAQIEKADWRGLTPLHRAIRNGNEAIVKLLLDRGAQMDATSFYGLTPLIQAIDDGEENIVKLLLDRGAQIEAKGRWGQTPLHCAMKNRNEAIVKVLQAEIARVEMIKGQSTAVKITL
ncbi:HET-domain-containing protein [Penicillium angulare]|uniref:HET-domain-containing protein n=1 Tax=Penicillium angulare TaxID=116970 RepID=A0A9W9K6A0_9EURO|nr:HET-domain-containing protein [Penicillium angulare]